MPDRAESKLRRVAETSGHSSYEIFAEWLRETRGNLEDRLARQDRRTEEIRTELTGKLEDIRAEHNSKLGEIFHQLSRLAGGVSELEKEREVAQAIAQETERERGKREHREERTVEGRRWKIGLWTGIACAVGGAALSASADVIAHAIGVL